MICEQKSPDMRFPARRVAFKACCYLSGSVTACWAEPQITAPRKAPLSPRQRGVGVSRPDAIWGVGAGSGSICLRAPLVKAHHIARSAPCNRKLKAAERQQKNKPTVKRIAGVRCAPSACLLLNFEPCCVVVAFSHPSTRQQGEV